MTAAYSHLPPILERFRSHYPKVEIQLTTEDPVLAVQQIQTQQIDLALPDDWRICRTALFFIILMIFHYRY